LLYRRTEGSSKEEQIIQKEQILAELQRVEKELQEKAQAQLLMSGTAAEQPPPPAARSSTKREAGEGQRGVGEGQEEIQPPAPFNFVLDQQGATLAATEVPVPLILAIYAPTIYMCSSITRASGRGYITINRDV
jgi:hypothetical protein